jgi:DNA-binding CsgD family transcriptional regulator
MRLHEQRVTRALLCDGDAFLGWFGVFHDAPLTAAQIAVIEPALPVLARRIATERKLESAPLVSAALDAVLEHIASPALVVSSQGRIFEVNSAARTMLATQRAEVAQAIVATLAGEPSTLAFELTPLASHGAPDHWLAVLKTRSADSRVAQAISRVATRLKLTRRQRDVLSRIVLGESNAMIATALAITERAVEQHVTALFDRTAVESRAALVAYVLVG